MKTLRSYVCDRWHEASSGWATLVDPCSEEPIARASSEGLDFSAALAHARERGGPTLRGMTLAQRGDLLLAMSAALHECRDELHQLSIENTGTTRRDAKFDVDGGIFTLSYYGNLGKDLGDQRYLVDGEGVQLGRSARFWGQHVWVPLQGVAVHVNAFNFPVWGLAEKAACALLAGMPVISKPATSTALVTERAVQALVDAGAVPAGVLGLICGSTGDLLDLLGPQDVLAFTGSAATALKLRGKANLLKSSTRTNVEADSLNAAVLGPDVRLDSDTGVAFVRDVTREMTQKTGQKCTAVRRIFVPRDAVDGVVAALTEGLQAIGVGNPRDAAVRMGPLATSQQLDEAISGVARLSANARRVVGSGKRIDGIGNPAGTGFFFEPTLLLASDLDEAGDVHRHEVFGPAATVLPYDGQAATAARGVALADGSLVTSVYSDDRAYLGEFLALGGAFTGRLYMGSAKVADQLPGSGLALPQVQHGGPGRAGGGVELGGWRGPALYMQRVALTGDRSLTDRLSGLR